MKRISFILLSLLIIANTFAQSISISSFKLLDTDLTANTAGTMEIDQNGETAALIKVVTTQTGFTFDGGVLGIVKTVQKPSEIWVYVPRGLKKITISHPQLGILRDYYLNTPIEPARTYEMVLLSGEVQTTIKQTRISQYIVFQLTPSNAVVELDGELLETTNGVASKLMKLGTYNYRVKAPNYFPEAGSVTIDDSKNKKIVNISLKPNFAHVNIKVDNNAEIWINGEIKGTGSWMGDLGAGVYELEAKKQGHKNTISTQEINPSSEIQVIQLQAPSPIFGELNISSNPPMSEVYLDGKLYGQTPLLLSDILIGKHKLEIKYNGYADYSSEVFVEEGIVNDINAKLNNYIPVTIECNAPSADFYIDGNSDGKASGAKRIEVGKHKIEVKPSVLENFIAFSKVVDIDGSSNSLEIKLEPRELDVYFESDLPNTYLFVNDIMVSANIGVIGNSSFKKKYSTGEYEIKFRHAGKNEIRKKVLFNSSQNKFSVSFKNRVISIGSDEKNILRSNSILNKENKEIPSQKASKIYDFGKYNGEVVEDKPHGYGIMVFKNGDKYEGEWTNGYPKKGKFFYSNGDIYNGEFKLLFRHGIGLCNYANGNKYDGLWLLDEPNYYLCTTADNNISCTIRKIEKKSKEIKFYMKFKNKGLAWCSIDKNTYIQIPNTEQKYVLKKAEGIAIAPKRTNTSVDVDFILTFPAPPSNVNTLDLIEPGDSAWKFWGIRLDKL